MSRGLCATAVAYPCEHCPKGPQHQRPNGRSNLSHSTCDCSVKFKCQTQAGTRQSSYCQTLCCTRDNVSSFKDTKWNSRHSCAVMCLSLLLLTILITFPVQQQLSVLSMARKSFWPSILVLLVKGLTGALLSVGQREEVPRPLTACQCIILQSRQLLVTSRCHKILPSDNPYLTSPWHSWNMVAILNFEILRG